MSFITKFNARKMLNYIDINAGKDLNIEDLCKSNLWILSNQEKKWLACAKTLFVDFDFFINKVYKKTIVSDTSTYIYEGINPSYHESVVCEKLNMDYKNFELPIEIKTRTAHEIEEFRKWFKENRELYENDLKRFLIKVEVQFKLKNPLPLKEIEAENSGHELVNDLTIEVIENDIEKIIANAEVYIKQSSKHKETIKRWGHKSHLTPDTENSKEIIKTWNNNFKKPLKDKLIKLFMLSYNPEMEFKEEHLRYAEFKPCLSCTSCEEGLN